QTLTARWDSSKQEHQKTFQETYLQLENQLIIKFLQIQQNVFTASSLSMAIIANKVGIKKNELRQRFIALLAAEKLAGRLDSTTDEYIFPTARIEVARSERPPQMAEEAEIPLMPLASLLGERFTEILKKWYPIIGTISAVTSLTIAVYSIFHILWVAILIPSLFFPLIFIYALYTRFLRKRK
ncbi:MAG: hypothetical protein LUQ65_06500, partial [Candidatus Helarchaeota archaeon]|nr:hypothetical protein [Candidatus Helarchaeota archaeon]